VKGSSNYEGNQFPRTGTLASLAQELPGATLKEKEEGNGQLCKEIRIPDLGPWPHRPWSSREQILKEIADGEWLDS